MRKAVFSVIFFILAFSAYAQRLPTVGIFPIERVSGGITDSDAAELTRLTIAELSSWGTMTVLSGAQAEEAEYLVRGQVLMQTGKLILRATTVLARTGNILNNSREESITVSSMSIVNYCAQITEHVPFPNFMLGRWTSTIDMADGPVTCILDFRSDHSVRAERYDTWEHNGTNSLKYQGIGTGRYTYAGYLRRTVTIGGRAIEADATVGINITLEDALPKFTLLNVGGLRVLFNEDKSSFELVSGALPCGDNFSGPSVYPRQDVYYTRFIKL